MTHSSTVSERRASLTASAVSCHDIPVDTLLRPHGLHSADLDYILNEAFEVEVVIPPELLDTFPPGDLSGYPGLMMWTERKENIAGGESLELDLDAAVARARSSFTDKMPRESDRGRTGTKVCVLSTMSIP
ncbi:hypothetical protein AYL99_07845 [Fonsecaea erecta]|uniref:Uncharacterized protein n=1 Tax=Fonsecaea erecta TaxID=1367422 RepID=A0A178ZIA9_9EURO|nr:hypothetical protein AYL99_07845 [Fonsecaea erecta]OAP58755.1 hypothetical protein AYL99_07845 [Fonsecaea erecta]